MASSNINRPSFGRPKSTPKKNIGLGFPTNGKNQSALGANNNTDFNKRQQDSGFAKENKQFSPLGTPFAPETYTNTKFNQAVSRRDSQVVRNQSNFITPPSFQPNIYDFNNQGNTTVGSADIWTYYIRAEDTLILLAEDSTGTYFLGDDFGLIPEVDTNRQYN